MHDLNGVWQTAACGVAPSSLCLGSTWRRASWLNTGTFLRLQLLLVIHSLATTWSYFTSFLPFIHCSLALWKTHRHLLFFIVKVCQKWEVVRRPWLKPPPVMSGMSPSLLICLKLWRISETWPISVPPLNASHLSSPHLWCHTLFSPVWRLIPRVLTHTEIFWSS